MVSIFFHDNKPVNSPARGNALVAALLKAQDSGDEVDVCYDGDYEEALENTSKQTRNEIGIQLMGWLATGLKTN